MRTTIEELQAQLDQQVAAQSITGLTAVQAVLGGEAASQMLWELKSALDAIPAGQGVRPDIVQLVTMFEAAVQVIDAEVERLSDIIGGGDA